MAETETPQKQLSKAPPPNGKPPEAKPPHYSVDVLVETEEGYHFRIAGEDLAPADMLVWLKKTSAGLKGAGLKPVRRDFVVEMAAPAAGGAVDTSGEAILIKSDEGPPRCSKHGPMRWVEGDKDGRHYKFWGCTVRGCRPKEQAA